MGTILQQSVLKGRQLDGSKEKDLLHKLFREAAANYSSQLAIYYEGIVIDVIRQRREKKSKKTRDTAYLDAQEKREEID